MGKDFSELASYFRPIAETFVDQCASNGVPVRIVDTGRTPAEQEQKLADGVSWTSHSKHEPQPPEDLSEAIDIAPLSVLAEHKPDWHPEHPDWQKIGRIGESLGLRWGGRWTHLNGGKGDPSHFEFVHRNQPQMHVDLSTQV